MFNVVVSKTQLIDAINHLEPGILGLRASASALELRGQYIKQVCALVAAHIEDCAADANGSVHGPVSAKDARIIADVGSDIAGQIEQAADREFEQSRQHFERATWHS